MDGWASERIGDAAFQDVNKHPKMIFSIGVQKQSLPLRGTDSGVDQD